METIRIPPSRIKYFIWIFLPGLFVLSFWHGQISNPAVPFLFTAIFLAWTWLIGKQFIHPQGGLTLTKEGISYREWGKPNKAFDMRWDEIDEIVVPRRFDFREYGDTIFLGTWIMCKGNVRATQTTADGISMVNNSFLSDAISSIARNMRLSRPIYWLNQKPKNVKVILDQHLADYRKNYS